MQPNKHKHSYSQETINNKMIASGDMLMTRSTEGELMIRVINEL